MYNFFVLLVENKFFSIFWIKKNDYFMNHESKYYKLILRIYNKICTQHFLQHFVKRFNDWLNDICTHHFLFFLSYVLPQIFNDIK